jgi:hypothetical protein
LRSFLCNWIARLGQKNRNILFIDQCAAHPRDSIALENVKILFFPPNCTSHLQPLDLGIIRAFKWQYTKHLIWKAATVIDRGLLSDASKMKIKLLTALHLITEA